MQGSARRDTSAWASALALTARTFIVCPCCENRGTLSRHTGEGMATRYRNRPARGSASRVPVGLPPLGGHIGITCDCRLFQRVERARSRDVQGEAAGPRSGRKRSAPRSSPLAAAATTPYGSVAMNYVDVTDPRTLNHRAIPRRLGFEHFDERPYHPFTPPHRRRSMTWLQPYLIGGRRMAQRCPGLGSFCTTGVRSSSWFANSTSTRRFCARPATVELVAM